VKRIRLIARLDIKSENLIKGIHLEGLRVIGTPSEYACKYYNQGADELIFMDTVASLYGRNHLGSIIKSVAKDIFIPMTVGGGIRSIDDAKAILRLGADKVAVNTAAINRPELISEISNLLGSQAMVLSVEAKKVASNKWEAYTNNGRESTGIDVMDWIERGQKLGAGEILLTAIHQEGTWSGFDINIIKKISDAVNIPVIANGGASSIEDIRKAVKEGQASAVGLGSMVVYQNKGMGVLVNFPDNEKLNRILK